MEKWKRCFLGVMVALACAAEPKLPALFSDGMVLQRDQQVAVWGWADPGESVTVSFAGQEKITMADADGKWRVDLDPMKASAQPRTLQVSSFKRQVSVSNVLVGEVWLCSGQSNMQMMVCKAGDFDKEQRGADQPLIRMFFTGLKTGRKVQADCAGSWMVCSPGTVGRFSATAYFFGRELHKALDVPVGLIRSSWGGSRIESWSPMASLEKFAPVMEYKAEEDVKAGLFDETQFTNQLEIWRKKVRQAKANGTKEPKRPRRPVHPHASHNYPGNLYNAMIHPLVPYGIRGAIWYQGEGNIHSVEQAILYRELLENLVVEWREDWNRDFPFYAVQLPSYNQPQTLPVEDSAWAAVRESFLTFSKEVPNTGIAVGIDVGEANNIHPKNKQAIGHRLAQQALAKTYGKAVVAGGPIFQSAGKDGGKIKVMFDDVGSGLVAQGGEPLKTFAIAGKDRHFVVAQATIAGDSVVVGSPDVQDPVAVRYAWADNPAGCNLFNKEGFPTSPFRTDDWLLFGSSSQENK